jgi:hypothetical protein
MNGRTTPPTASPASVLAANHYVNKAGSIAPQVWQEFAPLDGDELVCSDDGIIKVTVEGEIAGFDIDPDRPFSLYVAVMADRIQGIVMESRQQMVPDCPLHPAAHPLKSDVVNDAAAWTCPQTKSLIRYMKVTATAT